MSTLCNKCGEPKAPEVMIDGRCYECRTEALATKLEAVQAELDRLGSMADEVAHLRQVAKHGDQPLERDESGDIRFRENRAVRYLLDQGPFDLNKLAAMGWERWELAQILQLIGYPTKGYGESVSVSGKTYDRVWESKRRFKEEEKAEPEPMIPDKALAILARICILCDDCGDAYALTAERWSTQKTCDNCGSTSYTVKEG